MKKMIMDNKFVVIMVMAICLVSYFVNNSSQDGSTYRAGDGGISLKEMNEKEKEASVQSHTTVILQANQQNDVTLGQAVLISSMNYQNGSFYLGGAHTSVVSTEFGVMSPITYLNGGMDFGSFKLDGKIGKFNRNNLVANTFDPQFDNATTLMGKSVNTGNAMMLSLVSGKSSIGFGHFDGTSWYDFKNGAWFISGETPITQWLSLGGGVNFGEKTTGYAAAKVVANGNTLVVNGNNLGTENSNLLVTYNRSVAKNVNLTTAYYLKKQEQGVHVNANFTQKWGTLFASLGTKFADSSPKAYLGLGTSLIF